MITNLHFTQSFLLFVFSEIVMTPLKVGEGTTVKVERMKKEDLESQSVHYIASGPYKGIVIRKQVSGMYYRVLLI